MEKNEIQQIRDNTINHLLKLTKIDSLNSDIVDMMNGLLNVIMTIEVNFAEDYSSTINLCGYEQ